MTTEPDRVLKYPYRIQAAVIDVPVRVGAWATGTGGTLGNTVGQGVDEQNVIKLQNHLAEWKGNDNVSQKNVSLQAREIGWQGHPVQAIT